MKKVFFLALITLLFSACSDEGSHQESPKVDWTPHFYTGTALNNPEKGTSYLSIYSHIYSQTERHTHDLTVTVSMRNPNTSDRIYIDKIEYYNTSGELIRNYIDQTIFLEPMETLEIVINQGDTEGGSGANFMFDWQIDSMLAEPIFEAIMISTYGQQGLSFSTKGKRIK